MPDDFGVPTDLFNQGRLIVASHLERGVHVGAAIDLDAPPVDVEEDVLEFLLVSHVELLGVGVGT